jgi:urease accessory protein
MEPLPFIRTLQVIDSFFPVGAFAYSDGLETAAAGGRVHDVTTLGKWMENFLEQVFVPCEGLALVKCMFAIKENDLDMLYRVDEELTAIRPAASVRAASTGIGKRLLSLYASMYQNESAHAIVFSQCGVEESHAALAFGYNRLAGIVSAGLRLASIGQLQGQALLAKTMDRLPDVVDRILQMRHEPLRSFNPLLDIEQMNHQYVYSRLFRS